MRDSLSYSKSSFAKQIRDKNRLLFLGAKTECGQIICLLIHAVVFLAYKRNGFKRARCVTQQNEKKVQNPFGSAYFHREVKQFQSLGFQAMKIVCSILDSFKVMKSLKEVRV